MREQLAPAELVVAKIAARQHGVVAVEQLRAAGIERSGISRRVSAGRLHRVHRGVYAVGHSGLTIEGRWMAAVLACGKGAALSHMGAATLWGLLRPTAGPIDVSTPLRSGRARRPGIRLHRCPTLGPGLISQRQGIPVTTPARTIADLRGTVSPQLLRRAVRQAEVAGFPLGPGIDADRTRSELERDFLRLCRRAGLPEPEVNVRIGPWTVDFLWRAERLAVETDGYRYHRGSTAFEDDHARDLDLRRRGFAVRRFTYRQVRDRAAQVAADLRDALGLDS